MRRKRRSSARRITCPVHGCGVESTSQKQRLFAETSEQLIRHGFPRRSALLALLERSTHLMPNVWLEAFWCPECGDSRWYCVEQTPEGYIASFAADQLWRRTVGTADPLCGNPSVSEFTKRQARPPGLRG